MAIDRDHLARATGGDAVLQQELLALFRDQVAAVAASLDDAGTDALARHEWPRMLHRLRGAARAIGAEPLAAKLADVETMLDANTTNGPLAVALAGLRTSLEATAVAVDRLIAARERGGLAKAGESG